MNFEFSEEQYAFLEEVDRFLEENYDPEVMDPSRENMSQLVDTPKRRAFMKKIGQRLPGRRVRATMARAKPLYIGFRAGLH